MELLGVTGKYTVLQLYRNKFDERLLTSANVSLVIGSRKKKKHPLRVLPCDVARKYVWTFIYAPSACLSLLACCALGSKFKAMFHFVDPQEIKPAKKNEKKSGHGGECLENEAVA